MTSTNLSINLKEFPQGFPDASRDFECVEIEEPSADLKQDEIQAELVSLSMDPYMRGLMTPGSTYRETINLGEPIRGFGIAKVVKSSSKHFKVGSYISGVLPWQLRFNMNPSVSMFNRRIDRRHGEEDPKEPTAQLMQYLKTMKLPGISTFFGWMNKSSGNETPEFIADSFPLTYNTSILGMPGLTAYLGLMKLCQPKAGETLFVSAASGAVGQIVGQLGKMKGLRVVGSAGSDLKCKFLKTELDFDDAINYKTCGDIHKALKESCPKGIDCYFDNVGGETLDAVLLLANSGARIAICGAISQYNLKADEEPYGLKNSVQILTKNIKVEGFLVDRLIKQYGTTEAIMDMVEALAHKKLKYTEDIVIDKLNGAPQCFVRMLKGENMGKQQFKVLIN